MSSLKPLEQFSPDFTGLRVGWGGGDGASVERVLTVCSNGCMQLNKMASMPIYGEKASSPEPRKLYG